MRASRQIERSAQTGLSAMAIFGISAGSGPLESGLTRGCGRYRIRVCVVTSLISLADRFISYESRRTTG
jgi:hypothetical protein